MIEADATSTIRISAGVRMSPSKWVTQGAANTTAEPTRTAMIVTISSPRPKHCSTARRSPRARWKATKRSSARVIPKSISAAYVATVPGHGPYAALRESEPPEHDGRQNEAEHIAADQRSRLRSRVTENHRVVNWVAKVGERSRQ